MLINSLQPHLSQRNSKVHVNSCTQMSFKSLNTTKKASSVLTRDVFESSKGSLRFRLLGIREAYIKNNPDAFWYNQDRSCYRHLQD